MSEEKKGKGRPRKNTASKNDEVAHNENGQISDNNENQQNVDSDIPDDNNSGVSDIPDNDDDLKGFIKKDNKIKKPISENNISVSNNDIDNELDEEIKAFESQEGLNDVPKNDYNPLKEAVKQRGYTDGNMGLKPDENVVYTQEQGKGKQQEQVISEPNYTGVGHSKKPDIDATLINPTNTGGDGVLDIPDNDNYHNNQQNQQTKKPNNNNNNNNTNANSGVNNSTAKTEKKEEKESNLKDLSPAEKRKEVEKTADAILLAYRNYIPMAFCYFASHDVKKLKELEKKGQIDLATPMNRKGQTILDYIKEFNAEVEETFRITDAEIETIKPALVDVLMEKEIAFTPTQKLIFVLGQFLVAKIMMLIKFIRQKNADIKEFKKMHLEVLEKAEEIRLQNETVIRQQEEILAEMRKTNGTQQTQNTQSQTQTPQPQQQQTQNNNGNNLRVVKEETLKKDEVVTDVTPVSETKNNVTTTTEEKKPTLDDALETNVTEVVENENKNNTENDIPN
ncbi:MAG: hypothetical protein IPJ01_11690 [Micavibrio sp.]|nr:hypothetical protein [Micavibrio sp.]